MENSCSTLPTLQLQSTELEDAGAHSLSSDDEYFSDASEGRRKSSRPVTPASPVPKTRLERVDDEPAYGEVPGTPAYKTRAQDAVPDEVEIVPDGRVSKRSSQVLDPVTPLDPAETGYGDDPSSTAYRHRSADSVPDAIVKAAAPGTRRAFDFPDPAVPDRPKSPIPDTVITPPTLPLVAFAALSTVPDLLAATQQHLDYIFPSTTAESTAAASPPEAIDSASPIFPSDRSRSLWKQLVTPPPLQPPNWTQSRIRRLFLVSLGVPVDLDEVLPPSKQKKLILPDINLEPSRKSESDKALGSVTRLKQQAANDSSASIDSSQSGAKEGRSRGGRRHKGPPPPPDLDLSAVRRLCATTDEKLDGFTDAEIQAHVKELKLMTEKTAELLEYWLKRRDGLRKEKEAFDGVIENLVAHAGALLSIRARDPQSFVRYYSQLQPFYDYAELQKHQPSQNRSKITGLYLLLLLSQGDYAGFHTLLESLVVSEGQGDGSSEAKTVESDPYIKYPIEIERSLMEGSYDQVWRKTSGRDVPGDEFALFSEVCSLGFALFFLAHQRLGTHFASFFQILINTIRLEIASCAARSYPSLPITSAKNLLFLDSEGAVSEFARDQGWELRDARIYFPIVLEDGKSKDGDAALERELVSHVVGYARELETIV
ncbi:hypothetical protein DV737_g793, partial [Chaetothyriales sp. CBS 132003]